MTSSATFGDLADFVVDAIAADRDARRDRRPGDRRRPVARRLRRPPRVRPGPIRPAGDGRGDGAAPGESAGEWWTNTGFVSPEPFDEHEIFFHDVADDLFAESAHHVTAPASHLFDDPWPLERWPDVPTRFLLCRDDRFFPADFQRRVVRDRLGSTRTR